MDKINQFDFYEMGKTFNSLRRKGDVAPEDIFLDLMNATTEANLLLNGKPIPLGVSRKQAEGFITLLRSIQDEFFTRKDESGRKTFRFPDSSDDAIPEWKWNSLIGSLDRFETVLREELAETATYYIPRRGIYWTSALVESADESFPQEVRAVIPEKTKVDWRSAGRCLALNLLTASGFHVARAVEGMLEVYFQSLANRPGETLNGWGDYIDALDKVAKAQQKQGPTARTLAELRQMKDDFRNPIAHPRVVLSESDSRMLFNNGESLIICMAQDLMSASEDSLPSDRGSHGENNDKET